jgi:hypothetical protein
MMYQEIYESGESDYGTTECLYCPEAIQRHFRLYKDYWQHLREYKHNILSSPRDGGTAYGFYNNYSCEDYTPPQDMTRKPLKNIEIDDLTEDEIDLLIEDVQIWQYRQSLMLAA